MGKRKDINFSSSRPSLSKNSKGQFNWFMKKRGVVSRPIQKKKITNNLNIQGDDYL